MFKFLVTTLIFMQMSCVAFADTFGPLKGVTFGTGNKAVVIVLHGDMSKGGAADYHYKFAKTVAKKNKAVTVIALLRPGYYDSRKQKSSGSNNGRRDHYTKRNNDLVAKAIKSIQSSLKPKNTIVVGHSGGAAQLGSVIGRYPGITNSAVLVSCPCNINAWRSAKGARRWPNSQSPHKYLKKIPRSTKVIWVNGANDSNTRPKQAKAYVAQATAQSLNATYVGINGAGHGFNRMASKVAKIVKGELR